MAGATVISKGKASIKITGLGELFAKLRRVSPIAQEQGMRILNSAGERVFARSQAEAPVDDEDGGQLRASGRFYRARVSKRSGRVYASITYGGARLRRLAPGDNPLYAIVQHERLDLKHQRGSAKYLERPFIADRDRTKDALGDAIGGGLRGLG